MVKKFLVLVLLAVLPTLGTAQTSYNRFAPANGVLKGATTTYVTTPAVSGDIRVLWTGTCDATTFLRGDGSCQAPAGGGGGTVDSVGLIAPSVFSVTGSPVTTTGDITLDWATGLDANKVLATPNGSTGAVGLRSLVAGDIPLIPLTTGVTGTLPVANGGTGAATLTGPLKGNGTSAFSAALAADIYGLWSGTCSSSTFLSGDGSCQTPAPTGAALTRTDDTNVTLTLGGSPTVALLAGTSMTLGWNGQLSVARGGTGAATLTGPIKGNGTSALSAAASSDIYALWSGTCNSDTFLRGDGSCQTPSGGAGGANPTGTVGLSAVNGVSTSFLRADGAPALSQSIIPTWTGVHTFSARPVLSDGITVNDSARNVAALTDTAQTYGNTTDNPSYAFTGTGTMTVSGGFVGATATGGAQGAGTVNATAIYDDGVQITNQTGANPSASVGLSAVNGAATTFMRSDGAPALSQSIAPTWTGAHTFTQAQGSTRFDIVGPNTGQGWVTRYRDTTNNVSRGFIGIGTDALTGAAVTDFAISPGTSGSVVIGTANGGGVGTRFGPTGDITSNGTLSTADATVSTTASLTATFNSTNVSGAYSRWRNSGSSIGFVGSASPLVGGSASDFGILSTGQLILGSNGSALAATIATNGGLFMDGATGGSQGSGTVNATNLYINGVAVNAGVQSTATATLTMSNASCTGNSVTVRFVKVGDQVTIRIPSLGCATFNGSDKVLNASLTFPSGYAPSIVQQFGTTLYTGGTNVSATLILPTSGTWQWLQNAASGGSALNNASTGANGAAQSTTFTYTLN